MRIIIRIDRRSQDIQALWEELDSLTTSVSGLEVHRIDLRAADAGKYRDFIEVAALEHPDRAVLEWAAEELIDVFGWSVDVKQDQLDK